MQLWTHPAWYVLRRNQRLRKKKKCVNWHFTSNFSKLHSYVPFSCISVSKMYMCWTSLAGFSLLVSVIENNLKCHNQLCVNQQSTHPLPQSQVVLFTMISETQQQWFGKSIYLRQLWLIEYGNFSLFQTHHIIIWHQLDQSWLHTVCTVCKSVKWAVGDSGKFLLHFLVIMELSTGLFNNDSAGDPADKTEPSDLWGVYY